MTVTKGGDITVVIPARNAAATIDALAEHATNATALVRKSFGLEFDELGRIVSFQEPMLVVRLEIK